MSEKSSEAGRAFEANKRRTRNTAAKEEKGSKKTINQREKEGGEIRGGERNLSKSRDEVGDGGFGEGDEGREVRVMEKERGGEREKGEGGGRGRERGSG